MWMVMFACADVKAVSMMLGEFVYFIHLPLIEA
jgi:hypothetical protein